MDAHLFVNLAAWSAQLALMAAGGTLLLFLLRVDAPSVRYAWWRALLALCLVLPWVQGRETRAPVVSVVAAPTIDVVVQDSSVAVGDAGAAAWAPDWVAIGALLLIAGALLRLTWIAVSLMRLHQLRRAGEIADLQPDDVELQHTLGTGAEIRYIPDLQQPVTFGCRRPVVLLPAALRSEPAIRRAVLCHELLHVQRRDWNWVLLEELVRAVFWFHPAVWWMVSRVQLAREEVVDEIAILLTRSRRRYIEALLAFADGAPLAAAPAFLRRRHLFRRILLISKETAMSPRRVAVSSLVMGCAVLVGSWYAVEAFPLQQASAQDAPTAPGAPANGAAPTNPLPTPTFMVMPEYPSELTGTNVTGSVIIRMTIDLSGRVAESDAVGAYVNRGESNRDMAAASRAFVGAAQNAVRQWSYGLPVTGPTMVYAHFAFAPGRGTQLVSQATAPPSHEVLVASTPPPPSPPNPRVSATVATNPSPLTPAALVRRGFDSRRSAAGAGAAADRGATAPAASAAQSSRPSSPTQGRAGEVTPQEPSPSPRPPVRVGGNITAPTKIKDVKPAYPEEARASGVQGIVIIEATIDEQGKVRAARAIRSIPQLDQAALDAVRQWEFTPTLLNGRPIPIIMSVTVNFTLAPSVSATPGAAPPVNAVTAPAGTPLPLRIGGNLRAPRKITDVKPVYPAIAQSARVSGIVIIEVEIDTAGRVSDARVLRSIPLLDQAALDAVRQWAFTPTLLNGAPVPVVMSVTVNFTLTSRRDDSPSTVDGQTPVRVGGNIAMPRKTRDMAPVYPADAIAERVSGIVILELVIDTEGRVGSARVIRSIPLLDDAALNAVRQWRFTPTLLNGKPVPVVMSVTVPFTAPER